MNKQTITFTASEQTLTKTGGIEHYASDTISYIKAVFTLGDNWQGFDEVRAVFKSPYDCIPAVLDSNGECIVPVEVLLYKGKVRVNLVGSIVTETEITDRLTTHSVEALEIDEDVPICGKESKPISPSEYEQFVAKVANDANRAEAGATASEQSAQSASESATASANSASESSQSATASAESAQNASESAQSAETARDDAEDARDKILSMRATAETLEAGSDATASYSDGLLTLGIPRGDKGEQGIQGETGATPNLTIGAVETLEPTEDATASITGTAENPVLNLGLPKGDTGEVSLEDLEALLPTDTASGEIVTITDGQSVVPAKSLKVELEPIQSLNGYDHPWVGGAGENILSYPYASATGVYSGITYTDNWDGTITANGTATSTAYFDLVKVTTPKDIKAGTYTYSVNGTGGRVNIYIYTNGSWVSQGSATDGTPITFTVQEDTTYYAFLAIERGTTVNNQKFHLQLETGSTATAWTPYSNICPISGRTECVTSVCGKNLLDDAYRYDTNTSENYHIRYYWGGSGSTYYQKLLLKKDVTYTLSFDGAKASGIYVKSNSSTNAFVKFNAKSITFTPTEDFFFAADIYWVNDPTVSSVNPILSIGSTATDYEPYTNTTYTTTLGQTVYGGTLDVVSGVLTVDRAMVDLGTLTWSGNANFFYSMNFNAKSKSGSEVLSDAICDSYEQVGYDAVNGNNGKFGISANGTYLKICNTDYSTASEFKSAMSGHYICYELANPQTIQLTPQEVQLLLGTNNVWSDGDVTMTYNADIQRYIDKKLSGNSTTSMLSMSRPMVQTETTETEETETESI